jgi:hypothetical protein
MFMHMFAAFFVLHLIRRLFSTLLILALVIAVIVLWQRWQQERDRNRIPPWT